MVNDFIGDKKPVTQHCPMCEELAREVGRLQRILKQVYNVGHNDNCMFCGFKDKKIQETLEGGGK